MSSTRTIDDAHQQTVAVAQTFLLDTSQPGTLDGLRGHAEALAQAADDLSAALDRAEDTGAPAEYGGWSKII